MPPILEELRRRKVGRAVLSYGIAAFGVLEALDVAGPRIGVPEGVNTVAAWIAVLGLPLVAAVSWFYQWKDGRLHRDQTAHPSDFEASVQDVRKAWVSGAAGMAAAVLVGYAAWTTLLRAPAVSAGVVINEAARIAILPFRPTTSDAALVELGRNLVVTMGTTVESVGAVKTTDAGLVLARVQEDAKVMTPDEVVRVARDLGASSVVSGVIASSDAGLSIDFVLRAAEDGRELGSGLVSVDGRDLVALTDALTVELMRVVWRDGEAPTENLEALTTTSVAALLEFLDGERAFRAFDFPRAAEFYERAVAEDSMFALPHWRLVWMSGWLGNLLPLDSAIGARHQRLLDDLPNRERLHARAGLDGGVVGWIEDYERLVAEYPDYALGQFQLGDIVFHYGPLLGRPPNEADRIWERARELGALDRVMIEHYETLWRQQGTPERIVERARRGGTPGPDLAALEEYNWLWTRFEPLPETLVEQKVTSAPDVFSAAIVQAGLTRPQWGLQITAFSLGRAVTPRERSLARMSESVIRSQMGQWRSAQVSAEAAIDPRLPGSDLFAYRMGVLATWFADVEPDEVRGLRPLEPVRAAAFGALAPSDEGAQGNAVWLDGLLALRQGDAAAVEAALEALEERSAEYLTRSLALLADLQAGRSGAAVEMAELEYEFANRATSVAQRFPEVVVVNRVAAMERLLESGEAAEAERLGRAYDVAVAIPRHAYLRTLATPLLPLRGRALESLGKIDDARLWYGDYLRLMAGADPGFDDAVAGVRAALAELEAR
jgi:hypothetical protein